MAAPLFAPLVKLLPLLKILALGSVKFIGVGIGAAIAPVLTANFLVGLSSGTPFKYAKFRHRKGRFTAEQMAVIEDANQLIQNSIADTDESLTRAEAREFLKEVLIGTAVGMKKSVLSMPSLLGRFFNRAVTIISKPFSSNR